MNKLSISKYILSTSVFLFISLSILPSDTLAQEGSLTVSPARQTIVAKPGESKAINVKFINQADVPISGIFGAADFVVTDDSGTPTFIDTIPGYSTSYAAASWVKLPFEKGTIAAFDKLSLQIKVDIPLDAKPGGRYFGVFFEPTSSVPSQVGGFYEAGTGVQTRIAGLVYLRVAGPITENALIKSINVPSFSEYGPVIATSEIVNRGNYHIRPKGTITIFDMLGRNLGTVELEEHNIFPDAVRKYENEIGGKYLIGKHTLRLTALYGEGNQVLSATTTFWAFPWRLALVILLTIIIITLVIVILWKSLKGKQTKLEGKLEKEIHELESLKEKYSDSNPSHKS
ncbi:hypothetical protein ACFL0F_01795 [Patescibacteria group bacterium]